MGSQTLMRALDIMDKISDRPIKLVDLATEVGLNEGTARRLAHALRSRHYLTLTRDGFSLGPKLLHLGAMAHEQIDYVKIARPVMLALSKRTGFCVFACERDGDWALLLSHVAGAQRLRVAMSPSDQRPIVETGLGRTLLLDESEQTLESLAERTLSADQVEGFCNEMEAHRRAGFILSRYEADGAVCSISFPVRDASGTICISIGIVGAVHYIDDEKQDRLIEEVRISAEQASYSLGYVRLPSPKRKKNAQI